MARIEVESEVAGNVWKVEVKVGDSVAEGDVLELNLVGIIIVYPANMSTTADEASVERLHSQAQTKRLAR